MNTELVSQIDPFLNGISSIVLFRITLRASGVSFLGKAKMSSSDDEAVSVTGAFPIGTLAAAEAETAGVVSLEILAAGGALRPAGILGPAEVVPL